MYFVNFKFNTNKHFKTNKSLEILSVQIAFKSLNLDSGF